MFNQIIVQVQYSITWFISLDWMIIYLKLDIRCISTNGYIESFDWKRISIVFCLSKQIHWIIYFQLGIRGELFNGWIH